MKRVLIGSGIGLAGVATFLCVVAARYQPTVRPNTFAGPIAVGGLTPEEAEKKLRLWWEFEKLQKFDLVATGVTGTFPQLTATELGVQLDDVATAASLPMESFVTSAGAVVTGHAFGPAHYELVFKTTGKTYIDLANKVKAFVGNPHPARVDYVDGVVVKSPEVPPVELDVAAMPKAAIEAVKQNSAVELPLKTSPKHISDEALNEISSEVSEFSTHFPASNRPRCSNIKLAASRLNGVVLLPGDRLSFNDVVGRRTLRGGFQLAGVYKNGKHDTGVGGGICQVSTTLYNASLLGNLKIRRRSNHSMPVAYVPLGRDATVDYGNLDLVVENNYKTAIGVISEYEPGHLTFRILGQRDPDLEVKITTKPGKTDRKAAEIRYVRDPALPKGSQKVIEPGSIRRSILTFREVYKAGRLVETQSLGPSYYGGAVKIVAVGVGAALPQSTPDDDQTVGSPEPAPAIGG
jgi:vancomycin resistance protein YoaR